MTLLSHGRLKMTEGVRILEIRELLPPAKKKLQGKPMGKSHGKQQNKPFHKKQLHNRH
jgi:hypothetical protein